MCELLNYEWAFDLWVNFWIIGHLLMDSPQKEYFYHPWVKALVEGRISIGGMPKPSAGVRSMPAEWAVPSRIYTYLSISYVICHLPSIAFFLSYVKTVFL